MERTHSQEVDDLCWTNNMYLIDLVHLFSCRTLIYGSRLLLFIVCICNLGNVQISRISDSNINGKSIIS